MEEIIERENQYNNYPGAIFEELRGELKRAIAETELLSIAELKKKLRNIGELVDLLDGLWKRLIPTRQGVDADEEGTTDIIRESHESSFTVDERDMLGEKWEPLGKGGFSRVFKAKFKGCSVAVKVLDTLGENRDDLAEGKLLRHLNHDNIIAFRGMGVLKQSVSDLAEGSRFIIMEYMHHSIKTYVQKHNTYEREGLPKKLVWKFAKQIARGLAYLHTLAPPFHPVAHGDLKPDNILLDQVKMKVKLADFGLAHRRVMHEDDVSFANPRWAAPEVLARMQMDLESCYSDPENEVSQEIFDTATAGIALQDGSSESDIDFYMKADMFSYGAVVAYCLTGITPWPDKSDTGSMAWFIAWDKDRARIKIPAALADDDPVRLLINKCYADNPNERPENAQKAVEKHFKGVKNPYKLLTSKAEYFRCGFLKDTKIFVADSLIDKNSEGYFQTNTIPTGYPADCLLCVVDTSKESRDFVPDESSDVARNSNSSGLTAQWNHHDFYYERRRHFKKEARLKNIEDNPAIQLKNLTLLREGEEENQRLHLEFVEGTYVHHRAMRDVWMSLDDHEKEQATSYKGIVHPIFSTSFGLHVAVITADKKFFFCRRANRRGIASPKSFTCGAVESAAVKDYIVREDGTTFVSLLRTAARGLMEELRVELAEDEINAICLSTIYLKFDTHEWGMCGFVDLSDARIAPERRLTCAQLQSRFVAGPKDKFEHDLVEAVDFNLEAIVDFVHSNRHDFASSGKLVVVKVLQSFFGVTNVERAFQAFESP